MTNPLYCADCQVLGEQTCPACGGKLRPVRENDPVALCRANAVRASLLEPRLNEEKIPYAKVGRLGAAMVMRAGDFLEEYTFYVPYGALETVQALLAGWEEDAPG